MKLSIIWMVKPSEKTNKKTWDCLVKECRDYPDAVQILAYRAPDSWKKKYQEFPCEKVDLEYVVGFGKSSDMECYQDAACRLGQADIVTALNGGDTFSKGAFAEAERQMILHRETSVCMLEKISPEKKAVPFGSSQGLAHQSPKRIMLNNNYQTYPWFFSGTVIRASLLKEYAFPEVPRWDAERRMFFELLRKEGIGQLLFLRGHKLYDSVRREGDELFFPGIYEEGYYEPSLREFWIPYLSERRENEESIPLFIQYHALFSLNCRIQANWNNRNKHVIPEGKEQQFLQTAGELLRLLDEDVVFNAEKMPECSMNNSLTWVLGILRNGPDFRFDVRFIAGNPYYGAGRVTYNTVTNLRTNIQFMDFKEGYLEIDGTVHPILYSLAEEVYFRFDDKKYAISYNGRYGLTKVFGVSIYKAHGFHISIPIYKKEADHLICCALIDGREVRIGYSFDSHTSRMSSRFQNSYWWFGGNRPYLMTLEDEALYIRRQHMDDRKLQERKLRKEMWKVGITEDRRALLFILIRMVFFLLRPYFKRRPIWMYLDKIYKGGDSAEYLYKYASKQDNNFKHYYLLDKKTPDYRRLKKEGYHPLVRGSIKHRLVFLMADMMVISNSTVFTFNNFGMINSSYIRDLPDFHVCCVQHGMSVQKIALAQTRLRDNTRLYFCASKYELKNLSHPAYDYVGYDALKLTGVPRYDGLVNNDQKQIMISPTWRMQAAMPVQGSEGMQRSYNPLFKQSPYFKVYNALINDPRLIEAARKYGYKIKYVLHPIVSSQVKDFTRNDYVDIIPAAGDMSYEKMFCESSLMVTDFSGIQFDFAYMRKPLVYLHHRDIPQHYEEGSFFYDTMAFGEICHDNDELVDLLIEYMQNGCQMKEEYVRRADDFFYYRDHSNCERIYRVMVDYQDKYILGKGDGYPKKLQGIIDMTGRRPAAERAIELLARHERDPKPVTISDFYFDNDIREKTVLLLGLGHNVRGSMQYILNELNHNPLYSDFTMYVRVNAKTESIVNEYIQKNHWERTEAVRSDYKYGLLKETVKYLITETYFPDGWVKRDGQIVINIWHGTPWKKLGLAKNQKNLHKDGNTQKNFIEADYLMYPNEYTKKHMLESYKVAHLCGGKAAMIGYPRTGGMLEALSSDQTSLRQVLAPNGEKIYAYMPTWKAYLTEEAVVAETRELLDYLDSVLRDDQILYSNLHHKVSDVIDYGAYRHIKQFPPNVDSYALLAATEALITDYSSVFFDYLATRKQIILYCADYELYRKKRGVYMELDEMPFDKAVTKEEVIEAINRGKTYDDTAIYEQFCAYDSTENAAALCSLFLGESFSDHVTIEDLPKTNKKKVLVYSERFEPSEMTDAIEAMTKNYNKKKAEIYLSGEMFAIDNYKKRAYPLLKQNPIIGTRQELHLTGRGRSLTELYKEGEVTFEEYFDYMKYDLAVASWRIYGHARFDTVMMADILDPERILIFSLMEAERILFITPEMVAMVREGNHCMADAIQFAVPRCEGVYAVDSESASEIMKLLPALRGHIPVQKECYSSEERERLAEQPREQESVPVFDTKAGMGRLIPYPVPVRPWYRKMATRALPKGIRWRMKRLLRMK